MPMEHTCAALMAVLFVSGEAVEKQQLAEILGIQESALSKPLTELEAFLEEQKSPLELLYLENCVQLAVRREYYSYLVRMSHSRESQSLSAAALEVLAVIAYNQPVTRSFVEQVRGVNSNSILAGLCDRGLIEEAGRLELPGRPIAYRTTERFLRSFSLSSLADLPAVPQVSQEDTQEPQQVLSGFQE